MLLSGVIFASTLIMEVAVIAEAEISIRIITRFLNSHGYFYLQARKKGLMKEDDLKKRVIYRFLPTLRRGEGEFDQWVDYRQRPNDFCLGLSM